MRRKGEPSMQAMDGAASHCFVVDDEEDICFLISHTLTRHGITSSQFNNAKAAIDALDSMSPSAIFLDVSLEGSDAVDALRWLAETGYAGPIQIISGHNSAVLDNIKKIGER